MLSFKPAFSLLGQSSEGRIRPPGGKEPLQCGLADGLLPPLPSVCEFMQLSLPSASQAFAPTSRCLEGHASHSEELTPSLDLPRLGSETLPPSSELFFSHWSIGIQQGSSADRAQVGVRFRGGTEQEPLGRQGGADQREGGWGARGRGEGRVKKGILRKPLTSPPVPPSLLPFCKREDRVRGRDPEGEGAMGCPGLGSPQQLTGGWGGVEPVPQGAS